MSKYLVIGNPIEHSLSPKLHNFWIKVNNLDAIYEKKKLNKNELASLILEVKKKNIHGINVTVPFKKAVIPYLDKLTFESENTQSVNTIHLEDNKLIGHNTDIEGFERSINDFNSLTREEVYNKRKEKFLSIGRTKGFVLSSSTQESLSLQTNLLNDLLNKFKKYKNYVIAGGVLIVVILGILII